MTRAPQSLYQRAGLALLALLTLVGSAAPSVQAQDQAPTAEAPAVEAGAGGPAQLFLPLTQKGLPPNLIANGNFERGDLAGWEAGGAAASTAEARAGLWSARLANTQMRVTLPTTPGQAYKVLAWVKLASETGTDWGGFRVEAYGQGFRSIAHSGWRSIAAQGSGWVKLALTFTAELSATPVDIGYFGGPGRQVLAYVDDVYAFPKGQNRPPAASPALTPNWLPGLPATQAFALNGDDVDGAIVRVRWDFGDGGRDLRLAGTRRVALPGVYTATVTLADDDGAVVVLPVSWSAVAPGFPSVTITSPAAPTLTTDAPTVAVRGAASAGVTEVRVSTDRGALVTVSGAAAWEAAVPLAPGFNRVLVQARDAQGRVAAQERLVRYVPAGALAIAGLQHPATVGRWEMLTVTFDLQHSAATHPQFPYDPAPPRGLTQLDGVTAEAVFSPDNWRTVYRRPAFLMQAYERALKDNQEWLRPTGAPVWTVRFAPPAIGAWRFRIEVTEARGAVQSAERTFTVAASSLPNNHGPVRVAARDSRYFEYADGTPFLGAGHGLGFSTERFSYEAPEVFTAIGAGNQDFFRLWVNGHLWASAWQSWRSRTLASDGYVPATGLTLDRAYGAGLAAFRLDAANPILFQGFDSGRAALIPGRTYRLVVRWRTEAVAGPAVAGQPYGVAVKLMGWPEVGQTGRAPALISHVNGDTAWHVRSADFTATGNFAENVVLALENTTGGAAYIDEVALYEVGAGGASGPQLLRGPRANSHLGFDGARAAGMDALLAEADARGITLKLVIAEKNEFLLNHLGPEGLPAAAGGQFDAQPGTAGRWLHEAYWRYLFARFGAYRAVHSWELVNEAAPGFSDHFRLAAALAARAAADGNPHLASTSTWATLSEDAWRHPESAGIPYADFHAYVRGTGWLGPKDELANDSARLMNDYDLAVRAAGLGRPVIWGEQGIDTGDTNVEDPLLAQDTEGVWLHKLIWARTGPGGVYPLYWHTTAIFERSLHRIYGAWKRFMSGVPLTNGLYQEAAATASPATLRVIGQRDLTNGRAHLWIDHRAHTWRAVVAGAVVTPVSGTVRLALGRPGAAYTAQWYDTRTGLTTTRQTLTADAAGVVTLTVTNLATDTAVRLQRAAP